MDNWRMTPLTNGFSPKAGNTAHMMALYVMHYDIGRMSDTVKAQGDWETAPKVT
jgi:hypothetical protein